MSESIKKQNDVSTKKTSPEDNVFKRYPTPRGLSGHLAYFGGILYSRLFLKLSVVGKENIPKNPPYIISPNHVTYVDGMWVTSYLPRGHFKVFCSMAAMELEESHGVFGRLMMRAGRGIASDRFGNPVRSLILAKQQLEKEQILLLHPEGTRSSDGNLGEFKDGASYLAFKANCPILPVYIDGGYEVFNRHMNRPKPFSAPFKRKRVTIAYGKPLVPSDYEKPSQMTKALRSSIEQLRDSRV